mmetsp:Transcript_106744/g.244431  ORF Transcript_106744/g.244431 Transcript_106744/m.244431 type:complete len:235 (+) Transcript_106744:1154-1858(+)
MQAIRCADCGSTLLGITKNCSCFTVHLGINQAIQVFVAPGPPCSIRFNLVLTVTVVAVLRIAARRAALVVATPRYLMLPSVSARAARYRSTSEVQVPFQVVRPPILTVGPARITVLLVHAEMLHMDWRGVHRLICTAGDAVVTELLETEVLRTGWYGAGTKWYGGEKYPGAAVGHLPARRRSPAGHHRSRYAGATSSPSLAGNGVHWEHRSSIVRLVRSRPTILAPVHTHLAAA